MTEAAWRNPLGAITLFVTGKRLSIASRVTVRISTPRRPGRCSAPKPLKYSGVVVVMSDYCTGLALRRSDCQARCLLGTEHHASFFTRDGSTDDEKGR